MSIIIAFNKFTDDTVLIESANLLERGGIIVYPTETFYALGVDATNEKSVKKLFDLKERKGTKAISVLVKDFEMLKKYAAGIDEKAIKLINKFWPGPLTLVFREKGILTEILTGRTKTIGVRISSHPFAERFFKYFDLPITATSANISDSPNIISIEEAYDSFGDKVDIYLDGGILTGEQGSTVVDATADKFKILREGEISRELILDFLNSIR